MLRSSRGEADSTDDDLWDEEDDEGMPVSSAAGHNDNGTASMKLNEAGLRLADIPSSRAPSRIAVPLSSYSSGVVADCTGGAGVPMARPGHNISRAPRSVSDDDGEDTDRVLNRAALNQRLASNTKQKYTADGDDESDEKYSQSDFEPSEGMLSREESTPLEAVSEMIMPEERKAREPRSDAYFMTALTRAVDPGHRKESDPTRTGARVGSLLLKKPEVPRKSSARESVSEGLRIPVGAKQCPRCGGSFGVFGGEGSMLKSDVVSALGGGYCRNCKSCGVCIYVRDYLDKRRNMAMTWDQIREENAELRRWIKRLAHTAELAVPAIDRLMRAEAAERSNKFSPAVQRHVHNRLQPGGRNTSPSRRMLPTMDSRHVESNIAGTKKMLDAANKELKRLRKTHERAVDKQRELALEAERQALDTEIDKLRKAVRALKTETSRNDRDLTRAIKQEQEDPMAGGMLPSRGVQAPHLRVMRWIQLWPSRERSNSSVWKRRDGMRRIERSLRTLKLAMTKLTGLSRLRQALERQMPSLIQKEADLAAVLRDLKQRGEEESPIHHRNRSGSAAEDQQRETRIQLEARKTQLEAEVANLTRVIDQSQRNLMRSRRTHERDRLRLEAEMKDLEERLAQATSLERQHINEHVRLYCTLPSHVKCSLPRALRPDYSELIRNREHIPRGLPMGEDSRGASTATSERAGSPSRRGLARKTAEDSAPSPDLMAIKERAKHIEDATTSIADAAERRRRRRQDPVPEVDPCSAGGPKADSTSQQSADNLDAVIIDEPEATVLSQCNGISDGGEGDGDDGDGDDGGGDEQCEARCDVNASLKLEDTPGHRVREGNNNNHNHSVALPSLDSLFAPDSAGNSDPCIGKVPESLTGTGAQTRQQLRPSSVTVSVANPLDTLFTGRGDATIIDPSSSMNNESMVAPELAEIHLKPSTAGDSKGLLATLPVGDEDTNEYSYVEGTFCSVKEGEPDDDAASFSETGQHHDQGEYRPKFGRRAVQ